MVAALASLCGVAATFPIAYLLAHLGAALRPVRPASGAGDASNLVVLIPAHDEELVLGATLAALAAQDSPPAEVIVIADNCTDETARIARELGATVWERTDPERRGKGYALAWAVERVLRPSPPRPLSQATSVFFGEGECIRSFSPSSSETRSGLGEGVGGWGQFAILDADTQAEPAFCGELARALESADAVQGRYGVLSPEDGWRVGLMAAAFALVNHVRPLGADRLGGFVGLKGNGMGFTRETLERVKWRGDSVTEDLDFALDLALAGVRVRYAPLARVAAQMPTGGAPAATQRRRWEGGRLRLVKTRTIPLLRAGKFGAALELLVPPLAELVALLALWGGLAALSGERTLVLWWASAALWLAAYVVLGLWASGVSSRVWLSLLRAPFYVIWKLALRLGGPHGQGEWVRTARDSGEAAP